MSVAVRPERLDEADAIGDLTTAAFATAPHASGTEAAIVAALRRTDALALSLVAVEAGAIVGHVAVSPVTIGGQAGGWLGLGPVSVRPDRQRRGVGTALIREALARLRKAGAEGCVVLGDPAYYGRFGFEADPRLRLDGVPAEYFMRLSLGGPVPSGTVAFHAGFSGA